MGMTIRAAGAVLWREHDGRDEVGLVHRPKYDDWSLPKGKLDDGETDLEAAVREVTEETGHDVEVGPGLGEIRYCIDRDGVLVEKTVCYWAMRATDGAFHGGQEVDELRWCAPDDALAAVTYEQDREVLRRFLERQGDSGTPAGPAALAWHPGS